MKIDWYKRTDDGYDYCTIRTYLGDIDSVKDEELKLEMDRRGYNFIASKHEDDLRTLGFLER